MTSTTAGVSLEWWYCIGANRALIKTGWTQGKHLAGLKTSTRLPKNPRCLRPTALHCNWPTSLHRQGLRRRVPITVMGSRIYAGHTRLNIWNLKPHWWVQRSCLIFIMVNGALVAAWRRKDLDLTVHGGIYCSLFGYAQSLNFNSCGQILRLEERASSWPGMLDFIVATQVKKKWWLTHFDLNCSWILYCH